MFKILTGLDLQAALNLLSALAQLSPTELWAYGA